MAHNYDPAKQPCDPLHHPLCAGYDMCIAGPGGNDTLIENNEKGILETGLHQIISRQTTAELQSESASHREGIYRG